MDYKILEKTLDTCLCFTASDLKLEGFVDADLTLIVEKALQVVCSLWVVQQYHEIQICRKL